MWARCLSRFLPSGIASYLSKDIHLKSGLGVSGRNLRFTFRLPTQHCIYGSEMPNGAVIAQAKRRWRAVACHDCDSQREVGTKTPELDENWGTLKLPNGGVPRSIIQGIAQGMGSCTQEPALRE
jgi:hypothetical protein